MGGGPEPDGLRRRPLVYVDDLDRPHLDEADRHHFERVLRLEPGTAITVGDGQGGWRTATFGSDIEPTGPVAIEPPPSDPVTVGFTPVKGARPEWMVQKLTELGVDRIVPVITARSVVRWDPARQHKQEQRMASAARQACLQSRRLHRPVLAPVTTLGALVAAQPEMVLADPAGAAPGGSERTIVVGPEGGFTADEVASAPTMALPGRVLRAETAVVAAGLVLCGLRDQILAPPVTKGGQR